MEVEKKRCEKCKKSIPTLNFKCSYCEHYFCINHRLPEDHICHINYKSIVKQHNKIVLPELSDNHNYIKI